MEKTRAERLRHPCVSGRGACSNGQKASKNGKEACSGARLAGEWSNCHCATAQSLTRPPPPLDPQVAAGVAKKSPADKQLQRDAKAIVKKSMVPACSASLDPACACSRALTPAPLQLPQDAAQWTSSVLSGDRFVSHSSSAAAAAPPIAGEIPSHAGSCTTTRATSSAVCHAPLGHQPALAALFHLFLLILADTGLFTPEEYAARQKEVQAQADSSAAAVEEQKEAARREQSLEIQVARTRAALYAHSLSSFLAEEGAARSSSEKDVF